MNKSFTNSTFSNHVSLNQTWTNGSSLRPSNWSPFPDYGNCYNSGKNTQQIPGTIENYGNQRFLNLGQTWTKPTFPKGINGYITNQ
jgi:hypothetical protein